MCFFFDISIKTACKSDLRFFKACNQKTALESNDLSTLPLKTEVEIWGGGCACPSCPSRVTPLHTLTHTHYWLIKNSDEVSEVVSEVNQRGQVSSIKTYDFSTLYTNLPHKELKERITRLVKESFEGLGKKYISVDRHYNAIWTKNKRRSWLLLSCEDVEAMLHFLLDNVFIQVGGKVFQQCVGIPMGTNCAPLLPELLLHDYESSAMIRFSRTNGHPRAKSFEFTRLFIDDLISVNNPRFDKAIEKIYPSELTLKDTTLADGKVAYLDRQIEIRE